MRLLPKQNIQVGSDPGRWILLCFCLSLTACNEDPSQVQRLSLTLPELNNPNQILRTDDLPETAVLNLWASWCVPCRKEMPELHTLATEHNVPIYGLNYRDDAEDAQRWLDYYGDPFMQVGVDPDGRDLEALAESGLPQTFVVESNGRIRFHHIGPLTDTIMVEALLPALGRQEKKEL